MSSPDTTRANGEPVLRVRGLTVDVKTPEGARRLVFGVDFDLFRGETTALVGASGGGKSMTALAVAGALDPRLFTIGGEVILAGKDLLADPAARRLARGRRIGFAFQDPASALNPSYTIGAQLSDAARLDPALTGAAVTARVTERLERVGLRPASEFVRRYPHRLSGGQLRRVMLALALVHSPEVLIADESTTGLDMPLVVEWIDLLREFARETGLATLLVTHDWRVARAVAERTLVLNEGRIVEAGPTAELLAHPRHEYTRSLMRAAFGRTAVPDADLPGEDA